VFAAQEGFEDTLVVDGEEVEAFVGAVGVPLPVQLITPSARLGGRSGLGRLLAISH
jgi:hypothetical protein